MRFIRQRQISRDDLRANPECLYLFGDNMERRGFGGQAAEMRGMPNAVGCPTKHRPTNDPHAFFQDADFPRVRRTIDDAFDRLLEHLRRGGVVIAPLDGIGTGRADLAARAPEIFAYIEQRMSELHNVALDG